MDIQVILFSLIPAIIYGLTIYFTVPSKKIKPKLIFLYLVGGFLSVWFTVLHPDKVSFLVPQCPSGFRPKDIPQKPPSSPEEMRNRMFAHPERIPLGEKTAEQLSESRQWSNYYHFIMIISYVH